MVKKRLPTNPIYTFLKLFYEYLSNSKLTIIHQGTKYQLISLWSCDHSIGCICSFHYNPQFFRQFALAAVKMLLPHANAHAWHSSEGNREKRPRSAANCQHIRNREKTKRLFRWFTSRGNVEKASKSERSNFLPVTWSGWDGSLCLCGCRDKISRGLRFCHAVSGFEVGIFPKTKPEKSADGLIVCWPIAKYPEFVNILRQTLHAY